MAGDSALIECRKLRKDTCNCVWWVSYRHAGRGYDESAGTTNKTTAKAFLKGKIKQILSDKFVPPSVQKITVDELVKDLVAWYRAGFGKILHNRERFIADVESRWKRHLQPFFGGLKANALSTDLMRKYRSKRIEENFRIAEMRWLAKKENKSLAPDPSGKRARRG